jgi:hypothetical protein
MPLLIIPIYAKASNKYLSAIRLRILELSQLQSAPLVGQIEVDESYFGAKMG